jgi:tRNA dimethylallyltransferase
MPSHPPVLAIAGPTATGKSALALVLAEARDGEIVNADALQVYRGFDIGTAKPTPEERARMPHHLIDVQDPTERYSAGEFARRAREAIAEIHGRGKRALVVGGSGLYLRALLDGISPVPGGDRAVRRALRERVEAEGLPALYEELRRRDPPTAARLPPGDSQRILRALEVVEATGTRLSEWIARRPYGAERVAAVRLGLTLPRALLYDAIERRVARMIELGWVEEVSHLLARGLSPAAPAFQAIGYREIARHLAGEWSLERALEETIRATRRYAKRQLTWFRKEPDMIWLDARDVERDPASVLELWC